MTILIVWILKRFVNVIVKVLEINNSGEGGGGRNKIEGGGGRGVERFFKN